MAVGGCMRYLSIIVATTEMFDLGMQMARTVLDSQSQNGCQFRLLRPQARSMPFSADYVAIIAVAHLSAKRPCSSIASRCRH